MENNGNGRLAVMPECRFDDDEYTTLMLRLDLYEDQIVAQPYTKGIRVGAYIIDPLDLADKLGQMNVCSGLLPEGCLFWQRVSGEERVGLFVEPAVWLVQFKDEVLSVPLPGLVFVGQEHRYWVRAVRSRPVDKEDEIYHAPLPNVNGSGLICWGNADFPKAGPDTIQDAFNTFIGSRFLGHLVNGKSRQFPFDVALMWLELNRTGAEVYPEGDLLKCGTLGRLISQ